MKGHPLKPISIELMAEAPVPPQWPSFKGTAKFVGTSPSGRVAVYVDPSLSQPAAMKNAQDLVKDADRVVTANDALFGFVGVKVNVLVYAINGLTDGTGGADHMGCDYTTGSSIEVCASFGNSARVSALFEAELSECSMGGNLCGLSTGEALSRWCAIVIGNNVLTDFVTAPQWWQDGMPDYVNYTYDTDQDPDSTGCGMAFLSWLMSQGIGLDQIAREMVKLGDNGTLAQLYSNLTSDTVTNAWTVFQSAVQALDSITNDDPFGGATQPPQLAHQSLWTVTLAGKVFNTILEDIASGKPAHQIVARVRAVLLASPASKGSAEAMCRTDSRRLLPPSRKV